MVDALHTQKVTARYIGKKNYTHCVMEDKGNQATLQEILTALGREDFSPSGPNTSGH